MQFVGIALRWPMWRLALGRSAPKKPKRRRGGAVHIAYLVGFKVSGGRFWRRLCHRARFEHQQDHPCEKQGPQGQSPFEKIPCSGLGVHLWLLPYDTVSVRCHQFASPSSLLLLSAQTRGSFAVFLLKHVQWKKQKPRPGNLPKRGGRCHDMIREVSLWGGSAARPCSDGPCRGEPCYWRSACCLPSGNRRRNSGLARISGNCCSKFGLRCGVRHRK